MGRTFWYGTDLLPLIDRLTIDAMMTTLFPDCEPKHMEYNAVVAVYNDGIMELRNRLVDELTKEGEE